VGTPSIDPGLDAAVKIRRVSPKINSPRGTGGENSMHHIHPHHLLILVLFVVAVIAWARR
jgi:hypothetical protein